ncbi:lipase family protein [Lysobacter sp. CFH 32150]|uniref:lipase family protein n=1 Tax=Lysobacter sp. CFH 32150 TaxID=2927128 RepID=UPI001FA77BFA|nr:lipase family protein [Lysobacter sp. CFH 32150]MCI4568521.1 lipase family protein [Lysobacter sp. CFH 32150]
MAATQLTGLERDYFLAKASDLAYLSEAPLQDVLDRLRADFGPEWNAFPGAFASKLSGVPNLFYYAFINHASRELVLAFKGSDRPFSQDGLTDWLINNMLLAKTPIDWTAFASMNAHAAQGFLLGWTAGRVSVRTELDAITTYSTIHPGAWSLYITGHSLGGALAQLCFADLIGELANVAPDDPQFDKYSRALSFITEVYLCTFAAPNVGDQGFSDALALFTRTLAQRQRKVDGSVYELPNEFLGIYWANEQLERFCGLVPLFYAQSLSGQHPKYSDNPYFPQILNTGHSMGAYVKALQTLRNAAPQPMPRSVSKITFTSKSLLMTGACDVSLSIMHGNEPGTQAARTIVDPTSKSLKLERDYSRAQSSEDHIPWTSNDRLQLSFLPSVPSPKFELVLFDSVLLFDDREVARIDLIRVDSFNSTYLIGPTA